MKRKVPSIVARINWKPFSLNTLLFVLGAIMVYTTTNNWWAVFWCFIASLHFEVELNK